MIKTYKPNDTARIEAMLFECSPTSTARAQDWAKGDLDYTAKHSWQVRTLEGWVDMPFASYLIKGTNQEFYPCDPDVFEKRWVEA